VRRAAATLGAAGIVGLLAASSGVRAAPCTVLTYTFQPDCFRAAGAGSCAFDPNHMDFGPQIAVWLESADGASFVDTLMVTNAVAIHGIGNRPGTWNLLSGPRFPYGRRQMALPIWAVTRGKLYPFVGMNDGMEDELVGHENTSSPEPYFCRPMMPSEIVDAITCPSGQFRSAKGLLDATATSYYPPRADLFNFGGSPCLARVGYPGSCDFGDSAQYFALDDVDAVAAATPPYGAPYTGSWIVPAELPAGGYVLAVEVAKEFDTDAAHQHPSEQTAYDMQYYPTDGQPGNVGQPSVLYRVPFVLGSDTSASTSQIAGYGDWTGMTGTVNAPDDTISSDPGSGAGRLAALGGADGLARVALTLGDCSGIDCTATPTPVPLAVSFTAAADHSGTQATLTVLQSSENGGQPVVGYDVRFAPLPSSGAIDASEFSAWTPASGLTPATPGTTSTVEIDGLSPITTYGIGISAIGVCGRSAPTFQTIYTPAIPFNKLSGCFIATAAFGSDLGPEVALLRAARDIATAHSTLARTAVDLYYRASPPLAATLAHTSVGRAVVRAALRTITR
jgi:hypothetical protein